MRGELRFFKWLSYILFILTMLLLFLMVNEYRWGLQAGYTRCVMDFQAAPSNFMDTGAILRDTQAP